MTLKEYLLQATTLDIAINSMLGQLESYRKLASASAKNLTQAEKTSEKIARAEEELNRAIDNYVDTKTSIRELLSHIDNIEHRTVMELHYLNGYTWETVADKTYISIRNIHNIHNAALKVLEKYYMEAVA